METQPILIEEKRLVGTMMTKKISAQAFIVASITVVFMMIATLFYWMGADQWTDLLPAVRSKIFQQGQLWRIFTALFIHADIEHLLSNMYMLWIFSFFVFGYFGFGIFPFLSFGLAGVVNVITVLSYGPQVELLGASGLVYILGGFWLTLYPLIQRQYSVASRIIRALGISLIIFAPSSFVPSTSYRAHALGFLAGVIMGIFYFIKNKQAIRAEEIYKISYVENI